MTTQQARIEPDGRIVLRQTDAYRLQVELQADGDRRRSQAGPPFLQRPLGIAAAIFVIGGIGPNSLLAMLALAVLLFGAFCYGAQESRRSCCSCFAFNGCRQASRSFTPIGWAWMWPS